MAQPACSATLRLMQPRIWLVFWAASTHWVVHWCLLASALLQYIYAQYRAWGYFKGRNDPQVCRKTKTWRGLLQCIHGKMQLAQSTCSVSAAHPNTRKSLFSKHSLRYACTGWAVRPLSKPPNTAEILTQLRNVVTSFMSLILAVHFLVLYFCRHASLLHYSVPLCECTVSSLQPTQELSYPPMSWWAAWHCATASLAALKGQALLLCPARCFSQQCCRACRGSRLHLHWAALPSIRANCVIGLSVRRLFWGLVLVKEFPATV